MLVAAYYYQYQALVLVLLPAIVIVIVIRENNMNGCITRTRERKDEPEFRTIVEKDVLIDEEDY